MWNDDVKSRYWWAKMNHPIDSLIYELSKAEDEEEAELPQLRQLLENKNDLECFIPEDVDQIRKLLSILIEDTMKHSKFLAQAMKTLKSRADDHASQTL